MYTANTHAHAQANSGSGGEVNYIVHIVRISINNTVVCAA